MGDDEMSSFRDLLTPYDMYVAALYWSVTTITSVGYGDITPVNADEMLLCTFYIMLGSSVWAYIIGNVCGIMATLDIEAIEHHQTMDAMNVFMDDHSFPPELCNRLRE